MTSTVAVFLINSYAASLASYLAMHNFLWISGAVNYNDIITNSIKSA